MAGEGDVMLADEGRWRAGEDGVEELQDDVLELESGTWNTGTEMAGFICQPWSRPSAGASNVEWGSRRLEPGDPATDRDDRISFKQFN